MQQKAVTATTYTHERERERDSEMDRERQAEREREREKEYHPGTPEATADDLYISVLTDGRHTYTVCTQYCNCVLYMHTHLINCPPGNIDMVWRTWQKIIRDAVHSLRPLSLRLTAQ